MKTERLWHTCGAVVEMFVSSLGMSYYREFWAADDGRLLTRCPRCSEPLHYEFAEGRLNTKPPQPEDTSLTF